MANTKTPGLVVALFDLDGTLCNARHLASSIIGWQFRNPLKIPRAFVYLVVQLARLVLLKAGLLDYAHVVKVGNNELARLLKGLGESEALSLFREAARRTADTAREETLGLLRWHHKEGHAVILVSSGFQPFLREVGSLLGIVNAVGTALEETGGFYTGHLEGPVCHGDDRVRLIRRFIGSSGLDVDLSSSYAYGDRAQDIPTLEMVGHPVAVYPDRELLACAKERGWGVIGASVADESG